MKILFTCGGTAGHINPAVALARLFQERSGAESCSSGPRAAWRSGWSPRRALPWRR
ncbi:MAG: hypothetical protein ACLUNZ_10870 [Evtepia sp.]